MLANVDLRALIATLRELGVRRYRDGGVELELHTAPVQVPEAEPEQEEQPLNEEDEHAMLFRSAGGSFPKLRPRVPAVKVEPRGD